MDADSQAAIMAVTTGIPAPPPNSFQEAVMLSVAQREEVLDTLIKEHVRTGTFSFFEAFETAKRVDVDESARVPEVRYMLHMWEARNVLREDPDQGYRIRLG
jgi:hypothetical protein